jgi:hypothetical protein
MEQYSKEWMAELKRFVDAGQRFVANNNDRAAFDEFSEAGRKLGWIVPINQPGKAENWR